VPAGSPEQMLTNLFKMLQADLHKEDCTFEQVIVQATPKLRYEELMKVVDICARKHSTTGRGWGSLVSWSCPAGKVRTGETTSGGLSQFSFDENGTVPFGGVFAGH